MKPSVYSDVIIRPEQDTPHWDRLRRPWWAIHGISRQHEIPFAIAFPEWMENGFGLGYRMRLFFENAEQADTFLDHLDAWQAREEYLSEISRIRKIGHPCSYEAYMQRRISSGISKTGAIPLDVKQSLRDQARQRRIRQQEGLPFVRMRSANGNEFRLVLDRVQVNPSQTGRPNSYGLSRATQIVALPVW